MFSARQCYTNMPRTGAREGAKRLSGGGGAKCEIKHKATVFRRVSLLIGGLSSLAPLGAGPECA